MAPKRCCCFTCTVAHDDFNRADNADPGELWDGNAAIESNALRVSGLTSITNCFTGLKGAIWVRFKLIDAATVGTYTVKLGDPGGLLTVSIVFSGTFGAGGTFTISISGASEIVSYEYPWEILEETITVCYVPDIQISAGPSTTRADASAHPDWVTSCLDILYDQCWGTADEPKGNFHFVAGYFDNFVMKIHDAEKDGCPDCDCYCIETTAGVVTRTCVPPTLYLNLYSLGCGGLNGSHAMTQSRAIDINLTTSPTILPWTAKLEWVSAIITCPEALDQQMRFILRCGSDTEVYPRWVLKMVRWAEDDGDNSDGNLSCSRLGFDFDDADTIDIAKTQGNGISEAYASSGTCEPFSLDFPDLVEDSFGCNTNTGACCGGGIDSGNGIPGDPCEFGCESDPTRWTVGITE